MNDELIKYLDEKFNKVDIELTNIREDLKEARKERQGLKGRIDETYNT